MSVMDASKAAQGFRPGFAENLRFSRIFKIIPFRNYPFRIRMPVIWAPLASCCAEKRCAERHEDMYHVDIAN
jgi:hypothetical protein